MTPNATTATAGSTRTLTACGIVAGPFYVVVVVLQMLFRDGFDIGRHPASVLSNGDLGWVQTANFAITGLLFIACAIGLQGRWLSRLIGVLGAGMVLAAVFPADPVDGFPPGTPLGPPTTVSWQGFAHFLVAGIAFVALIAACFVFARRFAATGERGWAVASRVTGVLFLAGWLSIFAFAGSRVANLAFAAAIALALIWTALAVRRVSR